MKPDICLFDVRKHLLNISLYAKEQEEAMQGLERAMQELKKAEEQNPFASKTGVIFIRGKNIGEAGYSGSGFQCYRRIDGKNFCRAYNRLTGKLKTLSAKKALDLITEYIGEVDIYFAEFAFSKKGKIGYEVLEKFEWNEGVMEKETYHPHNKREIVLPGSKIYEYFKRKLKTIQH